MTQKKDITKALVDIADFAAQNPGEWADVRAEIIRAMQGMNETDDAILLRHVELGFKAKWPRKWLTYAAWKKEKDRPKRSLARRLRISRMTVYRHLQDFNNYLDQQSERLRRKSA